MATEDITSSRLTRWSSSPLPTSPGQPVWGGRLNNTVGLLCSEMRGCNRGGTSAGERRPPWHARPQGLRGEIGSGGLGSFSPGTRHLRRAACSSCPVQAQNGVLSGVRLDLICPKRILLAAQVDGVLASAAASSSSDGSSGKPPSSEGTGGAASGGAGGGSSASALGRSSSSGKTAQALGECLWHAAFRASLRHWRCIIGSGVLVQRRVESTSAYTQQNSIADSFSVIVQFASRQGLGGSVTHCSQNSMRKHLNALMLQEDHHYACLWELHVAA